MRKIILACALALSLSACAGNSLLVGGPSLSASIDNPVTPARLNAIEATFVGVAALAVGYRRLCLKGTLPPTCRDVVVKMGGYSRTARPLIARLRGYVKNNDQVNAIVVFQQLYGVVTDFQSYATTAGVVK